MTFPSSFPVGPGEHCTFSTSFPGDFLLLREEEETLGTSLALSLLTFS